MAVNLGREFQVPVPWGVIAGKEYGSPSGHPWIVWHAALDNCGSFDTLAPLFPLKEHRLLCCDNIGLGRSSHIYEGISYSIPIGLLQTQLVAAHFDLLQFGLMAHSMGGMFSMIYAATFPEKVTHLILLDTIKPLACPADSFVDRMRESLEELETTNERISRKKPTVFSYAKAKEKLLQSSGAGNMGEPILTSRSADLLLKRGTRPASDGRGVVFSRDPRHHNVQVYYRLTKDVILDMAGRLQHLPLLVIKADQGSAFGDDELDEQVLRVYRNNPRFTFARVPGSHHVHLNDPEVVYEKIEAFLKKHPGGSLSAKL